MLRNIVIALGLLLCLSGAAQAQDWATKMFDSTDHDFGNVPRGAKAQFFFKVKNLYQEEVHIASARSSCGCTTPTITRQNLKTHEEGAVIANFNTTSFLGSRTATLTVTIDRPYYAEIQLNVKGFIRSDVLLTPGGVEFGSVDAGSAASRKINIEYSGGQQWHITAIKSPSSHIVAEAVEVSRGSGRVIYEMTVNLDKDAPVGYLKEALTIVTNDRGAPEFPVDIEARVMPELTVSPSSLFLGSLRPGQEVTKQVVLKGKRPFRVTDITSSDSAFRVSKNEDAKMVHLVPVTFKAGDKSGKITGTISIKTDLNSKNVTDVVAYAQIEGGSEAGTVSHSAGPSGSTVSSLGLGGSTSSATPAKTVKSETTIKVKSTSDE